MANTLPAGPRRPALLQTIGVWSRPTATLERARARFGRRFTARLLGQPPLVIISEPDQVREIFQAPPDVLHPGEGAKLLRPLLGANSVILLDEDAHMEQRKLLLPAFHGERMQRLAGLMAELTDAELESWPRAQAFAVHPRLQRLTLEVILRAVFGLERGAQLDELRELLTRTLSYTENPLSLLPPPPPWLARFTPMAGFNATMQRADRLIFALIDERRAAGAEGDDVLALLLSARHEDDTPMSPQELRDELMTALVAGHETTASQLAWAFERLAREPAALARLQAELDEDDGDEYLTASIHEILRHRPVLPNAEPRLVKKPLEIGGIVYPPGVVLMVSAYLLHHDPDIYPEPYAFRPERFLGNQPGTYTWIPFGGGRRRCLGASFAMLEMKIVLAAVLRRFALSPAGAPERTRRRSITLSPAGGGTVIVRERDARGERATSAPREAAVPAAA